MWHVRLVGGPALYFGTDNPENCGYLGMDLGRTFCGCWGLDAYYRWSSARFSRDFDYRATKDGGYIHHFGAKLTYERSLGGSRFYAWGGLGGGYFISEDYLYDDEGWQVFGELGIGYIFTKNFRARLGVNVHGMDTVLTRRNPADDGQSRMLWLLAPVLELEVDF